MSIDGILNIDKPPGITSFGVVKLVRKLTGERRVGHGGTLDPGATGVLPILLGQATRVAEFLVGATKSYQAELELGVSTDTYDGAGKVVQRRDPSTVTREQVEGALASFLGLIEQLPPMYSAVSQGGRRLYQLARSGIEVERRMRAAEIFSLKLLEWRFPYLTIEVECSKGTYIRSLAHDLGEKLGCGAHLTKLVRLRSGLFDIKDAITISELEDAFRHSYWHEFIYPLDIVMLHWMAAIVNEGSELALIRGQPLPLGARAAPDEKCRAYSLDGCLIAVLRFQGEDLWHPDRVFRSNVSARMPRIGTTQVSNSL